MFIITSQCFSQCLRCTVISRDIFKGKRTLHYTPENMVLKTDANSPIINGNDLNWKLKGRTRF